MLNVMFKLKFHQKNTVKLVKTVTQSDALWELPHVNV